MRKKTKSVNKINVECDLRTERVPIYVVYMENGELVCDINDKDKFSMTHLIGFLRLQVKDMENFILYGDEI